MSGHTPLLQDEEETIRFHRIEGMKTIQDPQEVLQKIVAVITILDHILRDMKMLVEMAMASKSQSISPFQLSSILATHICKEMTYYGHNRTDIYCS